MKQNKTYIVERAVHGTEILSVVATSKTEAVEKVNSDHKDVEGLGFEIEKHSKATTAKTWEERLK